ncbi:MAG: hypothetical protein ABR886_02080 [Dehalococcoidales bacterium]
MSRVSDAETNKYGIIEPNQVAGKVYEVMSLVEKPETARAPSRLGIAARQEWRNTAYRCPGSAAQGAEALCPGAGR